MLKRLRKAAMKLLPRRRGATRPRLKGSSKSSTRYVRLKASLPALSAFRQWIRPNSETRSNLLTTPLMLKSWSVKRFKTSSSRRRASLKKLRKLETNCVKRRLQNWANRKRISSTSKKRPTLRSSRWLLCAKKSPNSVSFRLSLTKRTQLPNAQRFKRKQTWTTLQSTSRESGTGSRQRESSWQRRERARRAREEKRRRSEHVIYPIINESLNFGA